MAASDFPPPTPTDNVKTEQKSLLALASALAHSFVSGHVATDTAATLRKLFPGASLISLSVLAGGKLLISERNLIEPGIAKVSFDRVEDTTAGQALLQNKICSAELETARPNAFLDLEVASTDYDCTSLVSAPILRTRRSASFDLDIRPDSRSSHDRRSSISSDSGSQSASEQATLRSMQEPQFKALGSLTVGLPAGCQLSSRLLDNLVMLSEKLAQLLWHCCNNIILGLETLFCQPQLFGFEEQDAIKPESTLEPAWSSDEYVDEMVDTLICRSCRMDNHCMCKQQKDASDCIHETVTSTACPM